MNLSGILVVAAPGRLESCIAALSVLPGVEVHHREDAASRCIVVQEAPTVHDEMAGLLAIKAVPGVALAEMVCHYFPDGDTP